jgi:hypothetical protein
VQTVQYAFFGMALRPGWFVTSMGGGGGEGEGDDDDEVREYSTTLA